MAYPIVFLPENKKIMANEGSSLMNVAMQAGIFLNGSCAGRGICGKCKIFLLDGQKKELSKEETDCLSAKEINAGACLACQTFVNGPMTVMIPNSHGNSKRKKEMNTLPGDFVPQVETKKIYFKLPKASLEQQSSTLGRIREVLNQPELKMDSLALDRIQKASTVCRGKMTAVIHQDTLIDAEGEDTSDCCYGIALDIGTTTIVEMLWNLKTGKLEGTEATANPQCIYGADVISRIQFCREAKENTKYLQKLLIASVNSMTAELCMEHGVNPEQIYEMTVVGNTTMSHLFLGISPVSLARIPFSPVFQEGIWNRAETLDIHINPAARVYVLPNIAGHVGSDLTGVMMACNLSGLTGNTIVLDIGTNGEILAASNGRILACSTAAGPAFEGAGIQCGMRAASGAIEHVHIGEDVSVDVIDGEKPVGICGSGLIDAIAQMYNAGLINNKGKLLQKEEAESKNMPFAIVERLFGSGKEAGFLLWKASDQQGEDVFIGQADIQEVQLAKGAILGGIKTLMKKLKITVDNLDRIIIAGAFGSYIDKKSAIDMGLLPDIAEDKVISIGNGAGTGAAMALLSGKIKQRAEEESRETTHVELSRDLDFQEFYIESMMF